MPRAPRCHLALSGPNSRQPEEERGIRRNGPAVAGGAGGPGAGAPLHTRPCPYVKLGVIFTLTEWCWVLSVGGGSGGGGAAAAATARAHMRQIVPRALVAGMLQCGRGSAWLLVARGGAVSH